MVKKKGRTVKQTTKARFSPSFQREASAEVKALLKDLPTATEELQSLNEETTLNAEFQDKNELLSRSNDDLKKGAEKLTRVNQQLEDLAKFPQENPSPVMRVKKDGTILYANAACSLLASFNCQPGQVLPEQYQKIAAKVLDTGSPHLIEVEGKKRWFTLNFVPITKSGYVNVYGDDITRRKKVEEELQEAHSKLGKRIKERTAELQQTNERLKEENEERVSTERYLRLEEARLAALLRLSQMSEATIDETAGFILEQGIALTLSKIGFVGFLNEDESVYTLHAVSKDVVKECAVEGNPLQWHIAEAGIWADAIRKRKTLFVNDYSKPHPSKKGLPVGHPPVSRLMVVPLSEGDRIVAVAGMGNKNSDYDESDARQITLLLQGMWNHAQRKRSADALKEAYDKLEQRVEQRTMELAVSNATLQQEITEHKNTEENLKQSEARLMRSQEMAHLGSWELDLVNNRLSWSDEAYRIFGLKPQEFGATYEAFLEAIHPDDRAAVDAAYSGSLRGGKDSYEIEHRVVRKATGEIRHVHEKCQHVRDESGQIIRSIGMVHDITERKQAEAALRESESNLQLLWNTMGHGVVYQDSQGKIVRMNPAAESILGKTLEQFLGKTSEDVEHDCIRPDGSLFPGIEHPSMISLKTGQEIHGVVMGVYNPKEKAYRWINISAIPLFHSEENKPYQVYTIFDDITELKKVEDILAKSRNELAQANEQLKQYSQRITQVQEDERKRIAYELHDDTAQYLGILKMQIGALANSEEIQGQKIKEKLQYLERDANRAFDEVRRYSHELRPVVLEHQGLAAALEQIADDYNKLGQLTIEVNVAGKEPELSEEVKLGFFRIAQEALNNTRKHAKANQATINLRFYQKQVWMTVSDDGIGFDANEALKKSRGKGSLGLMSMRERADMIHADLQIESELGKGTKVILKYNPAKRGFYIKTNIGTRMVQ